MKLFSDENILNYLNTSKKIPSSSAGENAIAIDLTRQDKARWHVTMPKAATRV